MSRFKVIPSLCIATFVVISTSPASALMLRPELGMGMTDYLGSLAEECPATFPGVAFNNKWRPGMPCPTADMKVDPTDPAPVLPEPTESTQNAD